MLWSTWEERVTGWAVHGGLGMEPNNGYGNLEDWAPPAKEMRMYVW